MVKWEEFDDISRIVSKWLPQTGEGKNMATQASTAISKLVYKWYNDGDVYDNRYCLEGWANDLSSYANWLYNHLDIVELREIEHIMYNNQYEELLYRVASKFTEEYLKKLEVEPKVGSVYDEEGPFEFVEYNEYEDEEWLL